MSPMPPVMRSHLLSLFHTASTTSTNNVSWVHISGKFQYVNIYVNFIMVRCKFKPKLIMVLGRDPVWGSIQLLSRTKMTFFIHQYHTFYLNDNNAYLGRRLLWESWLLRLRRTVECNGELRLTTSCCWGCLWPGRASWPGRLCSWYRCGAGRGLKFTQ